MANLRSKLIKLAHQNPELRKDLLPLLKEAGSVAGLPVRPDSTVRQYYYKLSDGFYGLKGAIDQEGAMGSDRKVLRAMVALRAALKDLTLAMDPYAWD